MSPRRRTTRPAASIAAVFTAASLLASGCNLDGLQFTVDHRVEWLTPDRSVQSLPLTLTWRLEGYEMVGHDDSERDDAGYVAIFIDRIPQPPNEPLSVLARDDDSCIPSSGCPDLAWFNDHFVFPVESGQVLVVDRLPLPSSASRREVHDITLVLLDGQGRRQGETAFRLRVEIDRARKATAGGAT